MKDKETALDWLEDNLIGNPHSEEDFKHNIMIWGQAKQMEKEQIINAAHHGVDFENSPYKDAEEYYNKTYANDTTKGLPEEDSKRRAWHY